MSKSLKARSGAKKMRTGKAVVASKRRAPIKTSADRKRTVARRIRRKVVQHTVPSTHELPQLAVSVSEREARKSPPSFPFWPTSPFAVMRMWWG